MNEWQPRDQAGRRSVPAAGRTRIGFMLRDALGAAAASVFLFACLVPAVGRVAVSSKESTCRANLMRIGYANTVYSAQDAANMAIPVHPTEFLQSSTDPSYVGAYEWGGKSGIGEPDEPGAPYLGQLRGRCGTVAPAVSRIQARLQGAACGRPGVGDTVARMRRANLTKNNGMLPSVATPSVAMRSALGMVVAGALRACATATTWAVLVVAGVLGVPPALGQEHDDIRQLSGREAEVAELVEKMNPSGDDWESEQLYEGANKQLKSLGKILAHDGWTAESLAEVALPTAVATPLRPQPLHEDATTPGFIVRRVPVGVTPGGVMKPLPEALSELMQALPVTDERRFGFKIIGVNRTDGTHWRTQVRYEAFAAAADARRQQIASWDVGWELTEAGHFDHPRIADIRQTAFHETQTAGPTFVDCLAGILPDDPALAEQMGQGAMYWYGRVDAVGETIFMGHNGLAVADVNGDDLDDLYVAMGSGLPNRLLLQNPDGTMRDVSAEAGHVNWLDDTKGVLIVDIDNDGDQDLICAIGPSIVISLNDGAGKFRFSGHRIRAGTDASFYSLAAADYDLDGDLDLYACRYVKVGYGVSIPVPFHDANNGPPNHLLRNDGNGSFTDVTRDAGLGVNNARFSTACTWFDYDRDGDPDLYVTNDFGRNNLYRNDGGRFVDVAAEAGVEDQAAGMGAAWSDADLDGDFDLYVSNMFSSAGRRVSYQQRFKAAADEQVKREIQHHSLGNTLFLQEAGGAFRDVSDDAGVRIGRWAWGAKFVDFNNDGYEDIVSPNGFLTNEKVDDL